MLSNILKACDVKRPWRPSEIACAKRVELGRRLVIHSDSVQELRKSALGTVDALAGSGADCHLIALLGPGAAPADAMILANGTDPLKCTDGALLRSVEACFTEPLNLGYVCYEDGYATMVLRCGADDVSFSSPEERGNVQRSVVHPGHKKIKASALMETCKAYMNEGDVSSVVVDDDFVRRALRSDENIKNQVRSIIIIWKSLKNACILYLSLIPSYRPPQYPIADI
jgi:hypothetical protein